ncbi:flagellar assembly protein FliH [Bacillus sp. REN3]|uniref:flagellar assembly protein FliH n=1 Tax=Bacillus sp. REN3 TaxID=2802440 RepID=UPI001FEE3064|nr:flagellar assembly protein FliH [Bacillus sp. REN3]
MISLSRLIKSHLGSQEAGETKVISVRIVEMGTQEESRPDLSLMDADRARVLEKAAQEAEAIVAKATAEAEAIKQQIMKEQSGWEQQKALIAEEARTDGYTHGLEDGRREGYAEYRESILLAREMVEASKRDYHQHIESSEKVILELGMKVAGKILGKKISFEEEFLGLVKRALKNARDYKNIQLHIHPNHFQFLLAQKEELAAVFPQEVDFYIYPDDEMPEDACIIESENGRTDASVDSQLNEIKLRLFELLEDDSQ